jgi:hypothetical protein
MGTDKASIERRMCLEMLQGQVGEFRLLRFDGDGQYIYR